MLKKFFKKKKVNLGIMTCVSLAPLSSCHNNFKSSAHVLLINFRTMHSWIFVFLNCFPMISEFSGLSHLFPDFLACVE